jgi:hypothetical protein
VDRYTPTPEWWPENLPFSVFVKNPVGMDDVSTLVAYSGFTTEVLYKECKYFILFKASQKIFTHFIKEYIFMCYLYDQNYLH